MTTNTLGQMSANARQTSADVLVDILREQIQVLRDELQETRAERQAARERAAHLLRLVEQLQQRYDRLLDMPRSAPVMTQEHATCPPGPPPAQRGEMRQHILALLKDHPEGPQPGAGPAVAGCRQVTQVHHAGDGPGWAAQAGGGRGLCECVGEARLRQRCPPAWATGWRRDHVSGGLMHRTSEKV